jgi:DNA-binding transcriptional regulator YhcF (GntR family)
MLPVPLRLLLDRDLPVPLGTQLSGLLRYGIACGEFRAGDRLPSVRDLAEEVGVAPMTIAAVYRDLKRAGLIEARPGSGTFVARSTNGVGKDRRLLAFHQQIDALLDHGLTIGLSGADIAGLIAARLTIRQARGRSQHIVLVGIFAGATADYARAVAAALGPAANVGATTVDALQCTENARHLASAADLVLTFAHLRREVAALLPRQRVAAISFIPSEATRRALGSLEAGARVLAVSRFPEFLPLMRPGICRFAPHLDGVDAAVLDAPDLAARLAGHDVVVYATGAEAVLDRLPTGALAIEYRHSPDLGDIDRILRPLLDGAESAPETRKEAS